jgi:aminoglycoside 2'-N-acetyltransferase I
MLTAGVRIERLASAELSAALVKAIHELCDAAYQTDTASYFGAIGPGDHLLCWESDRLVSHLMWVTRWLQPGGGPLLRTAYVEMVATRPGLQRRGYATSLLKHFPSQVEQFDLAALSPATEPLYYRLGWRYWRGPLAVRIDRGLLPSPDEQVMVLRTPRTPPLDLDLPLSVEWRPGEVW